MNRWTKTLGAILASARLFTACAPSTDPEPDETSSEEVSNSGYVSGDGTVTGWAEGGRNDPVALAGEEVSVAGCVSGVGTVPVWGVRERHFPVELAGQPSDAEELDLADWQGSVVVLNFWYAACPPCRAEAPDLKAVAADAAEAGVEFLGVNSTDDPGTAAAFERTFAVPYPSLHDSRSQGVAALQGKVALQAVPTTVVLDTDGRVAARVIGRVDAVTLRTLIKDVQAEST